MARRNNGHVSAAAKLLIKTYYDDALVSFEFNYVEIPYSMFHGVTETTRLLQICWDGMTGWYRISMSMT